MPSLRTPGKTSISTEPVSNIGKVVGNGKTPFEMPFKKTQASVIFWEFEPSFDFVVSEKAFILIYVGILFCFTQAEQHTATKAQNATICSINVCRLLGKSIEVVELFIFMFI